MIPNKLKTKWQNGEPTVNGWLSIGNAFTAEIMAEQGFDSLTIDLQHGFLDYSDAKPMLQALRASGVTPLARVPWLDPGIIMKMLDGGAYGIICPMVNRPEQAAQLVEAMRYPPLGSRSFGPTRAKISSGGGNYASEANETVLAIAMIETAEAVENVDAICQTPGLDGIYIGPADLTLGVSNGALPPGFDRTEPEMVAVIKKILAAAKSAGIRAGLHCGTAEYAAKAVGWGFDMVTMSGDVAFLSGAAASNVRAVRSLLGQSTDPETPNSSGGY